jgi:hypothetical protein
MNKDQNKFTQPIDLYILKYIYYNNRNKKGFRMKVLWTLRCTKEQREKLKKKLNDIQKKTGEEQVFILLRLVGQK